MVEGIRGECAEGSAREFGVQDGAPDARREVGLQEARDFGRVIQPVEFQPHDFRDEPVADQAAAAIAEEQAEGDGEQRVPGAGAPWFFRRPHYSASVPRAIYAQPDLARGFKRARFLDIEADVSCRILGEQRSGKRFGEGFEQLVLRAFGESDDAVADGSVVERVFDVVACARGAGVGAKFAVNNQGLLHRALMGQNADDGSHLDGMDVDDILCVHGVTG